MEENKIKNKEAQIMYAEREIEKGEEQVREHKHKIDLYEKYIELAQKEHDIKKETFEKQLENFNFSEHYKPTETWLMSDEYKVYAKKLQEVIAEKQLLDIQEFIRTNNRFIQKSQEDMDSINKSLIMRRVEIDEMKKELEELKNE